MSTEKLTSSARGTPALQGPQRAALSGQWSPQSYGASQQHVLFYGVALRGRGGRGGGRGRGRDKVHTLTVYMHRRQLIRKNDCLGCVVLCFT